VFRSTSVFDPDSEAMVENLAIAPLCHSDFPMAQMTASKKPGAKAGDERIGKGIPPKSPVWKPRFNKPAIPAPRGDRRATLHANCVAAILSLEARIFPDLRDGNTNRPNAHRVRLARRGNPPSPLN